MSALERMVVNQRRDERRSRGDNMVPSVWRGTVMADREGDGLYVVIPRLTGDEWHGPLEYVGERPAVRDRVVLLAVEGRRDDFIISGVISR
ncbi:hypothetical protein [Nesterenkonia rhizosphaerae]|uniref:Uncharacterized protein n=1 Tax=Nesterenkonia rhizosphaerae TaxID=1348272 RepID=A0ABP9FU83_9MICC